MHPEINRLDGFLKAGYSSAHGTALLVGTGSTSNIAVDVPGSQLDRFTLGRRYRGAFVAVPSDLTLAPSAVLTVAVGMQHSDTTSAGSTWADIETRRQSVAGTAASSDAAPTTVVPSAGVDLSGAKRYVRPVLSIISISGATSSGQSITPQTWAVILGGADELPPETWRTGLASQV